VTDLIFQEPGVVETRQERALRRAAQLRNAFQSVFEVLAEIYRDEDWRYINDMVGRPYTGFTAFVQDQLGCAASNARRYQQGIVGLILPLQQVALPGARIPVTSTDVVRLGVAGARVVVEEAPAALEDKRDPDAQTEALRELIDSVAKRSTDPGFGPVRESTVPASPLGALVPAEVPDEWERTGPTAERHEAEVADFAHNGAELPREDTATVGVEANKPGSADDRPVWVSESPNKTPCPEPVPARPVWDVVPAEPAVIEDGPVATGAIESSNGASSVVDPDAARDLEAAIATILAVGDPALVAERLHSSAAAELAPRCLASGQRLVRLGQLLRTLS
jgi:hypothetical protein